MIEDNRKIQFAPPLMGEADFIEIFSRLKERSDAPHTLRVERVLDLLIRLAKMETAGMFTRNVSQSRWAAYKLAPGKAEAIGAVAALRAALSGYRWMSQVSPTSNGLRTILLPANRKELSPDDAWEYGVVGSLLAMTPYPGELARIRRCDECGERFFAAKRADQKYCKNACRQRRYDNDADVQERKRVAMRRLRADEKERARNPKSGVGLKSKAKTKKSSR